MAASIVGTTVLLTDLLRTTRNHRLLIRRLVLATSVIAFIGACAAGIESSTRDVRRADAFRIANPEIVPASMNEEGGGPRSPCFPSSDGTKGAGTIPATFCITSQS